MSTAQGAVSNDVATAALSLPAGQAAGSYSIDVSYSDSSGDFTDSGDTPSTLTVSAANVATIAQASSVAYSTSGQVLSLQATVSDTSSPANTVNEGNVTFTIEDAKGNSVGTTVGAVSNGVATAAFSLPTGQAPGAYTLQVAFSDPSGDFTDTSDKSAALTLNFTPPTGLVAQVFASVRAGAQLQDPTSLAAALDQVQGLYLAAAAQSPTQATALIQNESTLMYDLTLFFDQAVLEGITDPTLQAHIATLAQTVAGNPLYGTASGNALATSFGALLSASFDQPATVQPVAATALGQASSDNAQYGTASGYDLGVALGALTLTNFTAPDAALLSSLEALVQSAGSNPLYGTPAGYVMGLYAGALAASGLSP